MTLVENVANLLVRSNNCAADFRDIQSRWTAVESEIFGILDSVQIKSPAAMISAGGVDTYFHINWSDKRLIQVPKESVLIDIKQISAAGNRLANFGNDDDMEQGIDDVN